MGTGDYSYQRGMRGELPDAETHGYIGGILYWKWQERGESKFRWLLQIPDDLTVLVTLILPVAWSVRHAVSWWARRKHMSAGLCRVCGYDLRASPNRCSECGATHKAANPAGASPAAGN